MCQRMLREKSVTWARMPQRAAGVMTGSACPAIALLLFPGGWPGRQARYGNGAMSASSDTETLGVNLCDARL